MVRLLQRPSSGGQTSDFSLSLPRVEGVRRLCDPYKSMKPIHGGSTLITQSSFKGPLPASITLGIRFSTYEFGGHPIQTTVHPPSL